MTLEEIQGTLNHTSGLLNTLVERESVSEDYGEDINSLLEALDLAQDQLDKLHNILKELTA